MDKERTLFSLESLYIVVCALYVLGIMAFAILMFETREQLILIYLPFTFILLSMKPDGKIHLSLGKVPYQAVLYVIAGLMIASAVYFHSQYYTLMYERMGDYITADYIFGLILMVLAFMFTWFEFGPVIPILTLLFLFYAYFGRIFPGFLYHGGISLDRIIAVSSVEFAAGDGVLGSLPQIGITWVAIFAIFAGIAFGFGALDYIMKMSTLITIHSRHGIPQVAVIGSMIFGSFSGAPAANVAGTGSFTIPMMKRFGMPSSLAGAIESVASMGGQIMPPIMGAGAFLMASFLGKYYWDIVLIGILPAILFYVCVALVVYMYGRRFLTHNAQQKETVRVKLTWLDILEGLPLLVAIIVLVMVMTVFLVDVMLAGFFMIIAFLVTWIFWQAVSSEDRVNLPKLLWEKFLDGARRGAETSASIIAMLGCIGMIVAVLVQTGLAQKLSFAMIELSGGNMVILVLLVGILCVFLGMTVTTVGAYILTVTLAAPTLLQSGVPPLITHFAVFYFAMLGAITPPVGPACLIASGIARENFLRISWDALKIGISLVLLPFAFFTHPALILHSLNTVGAFFLVGVAILCVSLGFNLSYGGAKGYLIRFIYVFVGMLTLYYPSVIVQYVCVALSVVFLILEFRKLIKR